MGRKKTAKVINFSTYSLSKDISNKNRKSSKVNNNTKKREKNKRKISAKFILFILLIIAICCFCLFTPAFNVTSVKIEGINGTEYLDPISIDDIEDIDGELEKDTSTQQNEVVLLQTNHYTKQEIIDMSGIVMGVNIFKMNIGGMEKNIEKASYIKNATIKRVLPSTIKIEIEERVIKAYIDYIGAYMCIDETGYCVDSIKKDERNSSIPIVRGINPDDSSQGFIVGEMLNADDSIKLQRVVNVLSLIEKNELNLDILEIDVNDRDNVIVLINNGDIKINFGDMSNMNIKTPFLPAILEDKEGKKGTIYMNSDSDNIQPIFSEIIGG